MARWWCSALALGAALAAVPAGARAVEVQKCVVQRLADLPITGLDQNRIQVPVGMAGRSVPMTFDTGAAISAVSGAIVTELGLETRPLQSVGHAADGTSVNSSAGVADFRLGDIRSPVLWLPVLAGAGAGTGVLGTDLMAQYDIEIDPAAAKLSLYAKAHCPGKVVTWALQFYTLPFSRSPGGGIEVPVKLDGRDMTALVDTGAAATAIPLALAAELGVTADTAGGAGEARWHQFDSLTLDGIQVGHPKIALYAGVGFRPAEKTGFGSASNIRPAQLLLGMNLLKHFHLYIAYDEGLIYFTPL